MAMKKAQIENGIVVNLIEVDPGNVPEWCVDWPTADGVEIGGLFDGEEFSPAPAPVVDIDAMRSAMSLTFAQLLIGLVSEGWITAAEGRSWRDRVALPGPVVNLITSLPVEQQFAAETRAFAPSVILRLDPLVVGLGLHTGKTPEQIDDFFRKYQNA